MDIQWTLSVSAVGENNETGPSKKLLKGYLERMIPTSCESREVLASSGLVSLILKQNETKT